MDEDFMLWNFLEEERERYSNQDNSDLTEAQQQYEEEEEDEMDDEDLMELIAEKLGQGLIRQGGNY